MQTQSKLLLVDDEPHSIHLLQRLFQLSYEVFTATSGSKALKIIATHDIQVIVADQQMPGMSGAQLLSIVRQRSPTTLGILLSDHADLATLAGSAHETGIFRFMHKPWNIAEIKTSVREACELSIRLREMALKRKPALPPRDQVGPVAQAVNGAAAPSLLVLVGSEVDRLEIMQMFAGDYSVQGAADVAEALKVIEEQDVGVVICEAHVGSKYNGPFLRMLTLSQPLVQTVMLTSTADSELINKMIKQVQIFRFVMKPVVRPHVLLFAVSAAMKEHLSLRSNARLPSPPGAAQTTPPEAFNQGSAEQ
ncbi:DNA-binding NtrC family response regulator [Polaromonas sp. CG_9.5]|uniref:response regulator n=1 Tax=Polaromonas sp. CG_9.5 TaxID=3071705 RepID=UPI002E0C7C37|nr:DNA-binding NtrC family response regulator [Polaromonas sp. CG_9.5]